MGRKKHKWEWKKENWKLNSRKGWPALHFSKQSYAGNRIQESFPLLDQGDLCTLVFIQCKKRPNFQDPFNDGIVPTPPTMKIYEDLFIPGFGSFGRKLAGSVLAMKGRKLLAMSSLESQKVIFGNSG